MLQSYILAWASSVSSVDWAMILLFGLVLWLIGLVRINHTGGRL